MNKIIEKAATTVFFLLAISASSMIPSFACSLSYVPLNKLNSAEYVFIGEVVGYTKLYEKELPKRTPPAGIDEKYAQWGEPTRAVGIIVNVQNNIFTPKPPNGLFEVIPYSLMADCSYQGRYATEAKIAADFPLGAKVRVIASESLTFPNLAAQNNLRLDVKFGDGLLRNDDPANPPPVSAEAKTDYRKIDPRDYKMIDYLEFELRKDLARLESAASLAEKRATLKRLIYFPHAWRFDYEGAVKNYLPERDAELREKLIKLRKEFLEKQKTENVQ